MTIPAHLWPDVSKSQKLHRHAIAADGISLWPKAACGKLFSRSELDDAECLTDAEAAIIPDHLCQKCQDTMERPAP